MTSEALVVLPADEVFEGKSTGGASEAGWHSIEPAFRCWKEFQYATVRGIRKRFSGMSDALQIGILFHAGRARWFARKFEGDEWRGVVIEAKQALENEQRMQISSEVLARSTQLLEGYTAHWRTRPRPRPLAAELKLGPAPLVEGDPFPLWKTARLDDVSRYPEFGNELWIGDAKTTSEDFGSVIETYTLHGQFLQGMALWNATRRKDLGPVRGIVLDMVKKPYGKSRAAYARHAFEVPENALAWFVQDLRARTRMAASMDWNTDVPGMRNVTACTRMHGRIRRPCGFRELCMYGKGGTAGFVLRDGSSLVAWKPSADAAITPWA